MGQAPATLKSEYGDLASDLRRYVDAYGGLRRFALSPYTHLALIVTILCWGKWLNGDWTTAPLLVLPALLGFSLAAYALLLGFGDESFRKLLATKLAPTETDRENQFVGAAAVFLHFVIVEVVALLLAVICATNPLASMGLSKQVANLLCHLPPGTLHRVFAFIGTFAFNLSIVMALAAAINIFHVVGWYFDYVNLPNRK